MTEVWVNDEVVGFHEGGFTPFEFRVDNIIKVGANNVLTIRVVGPIFLSDKEVDGMKALETPQWRGGYNGRYLAICSSSCYRRSLCGRCIH